MAKCGSIFDVYGLDPREYDDPDQSELLLYETINFNHIGMSMLMIF